MANQGSSEGERSRGVGELDSRPSGNASFRVGDHPPGAGTFSGSSAFRQDDRHKLTASRPTSRWRVTIAITIEVEPAMSGRLVLATRVWKFGPTWVTSSSSRVGTQVCYGYRTTMICQTESRWRVLVTHSKIGVHRSELRRFLVDTQAALDADATDLVLEAVINECGGYRFDPVGLEKRIKAAVKATDLTVVVLTPDFDDSVWCDLEIRERAFSMCPDCPSHRLFPLIWRDREPSWRLDGLWDKRRICSEGWGIDLSDLLDDDVIARIRGGEESASIPAWTKAIRRSADGLARFVAEVKATCVHEECAARVPTETALIDDSWLERQD